MVTTDDIFANRATDEFAIIQRGQRIAFGQARDLRVLMIRGNENVIGLIERGGEAREFIGVVIPVDLQVQVAAVKSAERIVAIHAEGKRIIVVRFVDDGGAGDGEDALIDLQAQIILNALCDFHGLIEFKREFISARVFCGGEVGCQ